MRLRLRLRGDENNANDVARHALRFGWQRRGLSDLSDGGGGGFVRTVRILYGSQGGTAQLFATQLGNELEELLPSMSSLSLTELPTPTAQGVIVSALNEPNGSSPKDRIVVGPSTINVIVTSVTGVGDPPDNCREFYEWIMASASANAATNTTDDDDDDDDDDDNGDDDDDNVRNALDWTNVRYAVFGCGNSVAHPKHYNAIAKNLDKRLEELGAIRVHKLGLGDDSECIDDDFDTWQDSFIEYLTNANAAGPSEEVGVVTGAEEEVPADDKIEKEEDIVSISTVANQHHPLRVPKVESCWDDEEIVSDSADAEPLRKGRPSKYPRLRLAKYNDGRYDLPRYDLFHLCDSARMAEGVAENNDGMTTAMATSKMALTPFYKPGTKPLQVLSNRAVAIGSAEYVMREMRFSLEDHPDVSYHAGDHLMVYGRNAQCLVDSYLAVLEGVDGSDLIEGLEVVEEEEKQVEDEQQQQQQQQQQRGGGGEDVDGGNPSKASRRAYPHPFGVTVEETLLHCVDLTHPPSPSFARSILGRKDINYKEDIAATRVTPIELIRASGNAPSLEELLFNLPPMQPRYYSIASSPKVHNREIYITFRPVKYITKLGHLREGLCTSFMKQTHPVSIDGGFADAGIIHPRIPALVNPNPTFRLPPDPFTPILLVAGGCGVAPIRAFLEERMHMYWQGKASDDGGNGATLGPARVYLGFRSPRDEVYRHLVDTSLRNGIVDSVRVTYAKSCNKADKSCTLVTQVLDEDSDIIYDLLKNRGAHVYLCGGARQFGAAIEQALLRIFMTRGNMNEDEADDYLRTLLNEGRLQEDLAD